MIFYLRHLTSPSHLLEHKRRALRLKASKYCFIDQGLGWRNHDDVILRCVYPEEAASLMKEFHQGLCGGHHATKATTHKILRCSYYWPTIFTDCTSSSRNAIHVSPLQPVVVEAPFQQWGLDFIEEFKDNSSNGHK